MLIPQWAARAILPWGTTTVCTDPHEIANVAGRQGVAFMLDNARKAGLRQYILAPSCVPAVPGLESAGASFSAQDVAELLDMPGVIGIAEMMDYIGLAHGAERMRDIAAEGLRRGAYLQGHAPAPAAACWQPTARPALYPITRAAPLRRSGKSCAADCTSTCGPAPLWTGWKS